MSVEEICLVTSETCRDMTNLHEFTILACTIRNEPSISFHAWLQCLSGVLKIQYTRQYSFATGSVK